MLLCYCLSQCQCFIKLKDARSKVGLNKCIRGRRNEVLELHNGPISKSFIKYEIHRYRCYIYPKLSFYLSCVKYSMLLIKKTINLMSANQSSTSFVT